MSSTSIERASLPNRDSSLIAGRFRIISLLGSGGSASVFEARDLETANNVALKILHPHLSGSPAMRKGFLLEADAAENLHHPNIAMILGYGVHESLDESLAWIALELAPGASLAEHVRRHGPLPVSDALAVADGLLLALEAAHARGLVHRDVSPANVMVDDTEEGPIRAEDVRLVDFGLADVVGRPVLGSDLVRSGQAGTTPVPIGVLGSVNYMSPEQATGESVDERGDIYQAGATLYFALTGLPPYVRASPEAVMRAHLEAPPPVPSVLVRGIPRTVDQVIVKAMGTAWADRFASAGDMRRAILEARETGEHFEHTRRFPAPSSTSLRSDQTTIYRRPTPRIGRLERARLSTSGHPLPAARPRGVAALITAGAILAVVAIAWALAASSAPRPSLAETPLPTSPPSATPSEPTIVASPRVRPPTTRTVPSLVALSLPDAQLQLEEAGLVLGTVSITNSSAAKETVLSAPGVSAGASVPAGARIDIVVASGSNTVPRVVGLTASSAMDVVRGAGFIAVRQDQSDADHESETVLGSIPGESALRAVGTEVVIEVAIAVVPLSTATPEPTPAPSSTPVPRPATP